MASRQKVLKSNSERKREVRSQKLGLVWDKERGPEKVVTDCQGEISRSKRN